jgi:spermidine/putrescine transport system substrate-binding protein
MPQSVLDAFTAEYGVKVRYLVYESQEEAIDNLRAGEVYDVVVMESRFIPLLAQQGLLAELHSENVSNLKNISANFRELAYDPTNQYSIPYNWGTTGLVVRTDLAEEPISRWADLWDSRYAGRVGLWMGQRREVISLTLKSLGYSANSEEPAELEEALRRLIELKPDVLTLEEYDLYTSAELLASGKLVISMGYAYDVIASSDQNPSIQYVLPVEGALLWNDTFIIPGNSPNQYTAELLLNFLMRPEINAMIVNENLYATPNEAAYPFIDLVNAEPILPLTSRGQELYDSIWERFEGAP